MTDRADMPSYAPWTATFADGPLGDDNQDRHFVVGPPWPDMWLIESPVRALRWLIVGGTGFPPRDPPWPGQVHYTLHGVHVEHGEQIAVYQQVAVGGRTP
jgi:hypothetical protein